MKDREDKISGKIKVSNGAKKQRGKIRIIKKLAHFESEIIFQQVYQNYCAEFFTRLKLEQ